MTHDHLTLIRRYYDACSAGDVDAMRATLADDVEHYFLAPNPGSAPVRGAETLARYWQKIQARFDARWIVDRCVTAGDEAIIEWSMFWTPSDGARRVAIRGAESYLIHEGKIAEIRAFYQQDPSRSTELEGFPYDERGYSMLGRERSAAHP